MYGKANLEKLIYGLRDAVDGLRIAAIAEREAARMCVRHGLDWEQIDYHRSEATKFDDEADRLLELLEGRSDQLKTGTH